MESWGIRFRVPGGREVWMSPGGSGAMIAEHAAKFPSREAAETHVRRITGPKSSIAARVVRIP